MTDLEHFSLRWNNFHNNLSSGFRALLNEDALVDVTLAADGRFLQAHRLVLSVCSPYFKQLFTLNPCKHPIVILKDVHHKQLSDLLNFMYEGEVNVRQEDLATFLKTAELLQIKGLTGQETDNSFLPQGPDDHQSRSSTHFPLPIEPLTNTVPRHRTVRRIRHQEKHGATLIASPAESHASPVPSPPPNKRIRPSTSSPIVVSGDDDEAKNEETRSSASDREKRTVNVKIEPPCDYESVDTPLEGSVQQDDRNASAKEDSLFPVITSQASLSETHDPLGFTNETEGISQRKSVQRPLHQSHLNIASTSGSSASAADNNVSSDGEQAGQLIYVTSSRGRTHLLHQGHRYYVHHQAVHGESRWRCLQHRKRGCRAYVRVGPDAKHVVKYGTSHNHTPPFAYHENRWVPIPVRLSSSDLESSSFFDNTSENTEQNLLPELLW